MKRRAGWSPAWLLAAAVLAGAASAPATAADEDIAVQVDIRDDVVMVDVDLGFAATPCEVWAVLTDFENLPRFVANITASKVLARDGNLVRVAQTGKTSFGPLSFQFASERELKLTPCERLESRMLKGNMKRLQGVTRLETVAGRTRLRYHSEAVPETPVPPGIGRSLIESETREHYSDIRREVLKRKSLAAAG